MPHKMTFASMPLDSRSAYTKLDWIVWTATMADRKEDFEALIQRLPEGARQVFVLHDVEGFKHEEIAQMIGASRETVTRLFADFKRKQLLRVKGSTLIIKDKTGLEGVLSS